MEENRKMGQIQELRQAVREEADTCDKEPLLISAAVSAGKQTIDASYDIPTMAKLAKNEANFLKIIPQIY